jgi:hypothetical protein
MLGLSDREFKITITKMRKSLVEKEENMHEK